MSAKPRIDKPVPSIPLIVKERFILLPEITLPLMLTDPRMIEFFGELAAAGGYLGFVQPQEPEAGGETWCQDVGCLGRAVAEEHHSTSLFVKFEGVIRFRIRKAYPLTADEVLPSAEVDYREFVQDLEEQDEDLSGWDLERIKAALVNIARAQGPSEEASFESQPPRQIIKRMAQVLPLSTDEKQALLETRTFREFLELFFPLLSANFLTTTPDIGGKQVH